MAQFILVVYIGPKFLSNGITWPWDVLEGSKLSNSHLNVFRSKQSIFVWFSTHINSHFKSDLASEYGPTEPFESHMEIPENSETRFIL
jgi:hypothetical protein